MLFYYTSHTKNIQMHNFKQKKNYTYATIISYDSINVYIDDNIYIYFFNMNYILFIYIYIYIYITFIHNILSLIYFFFDFIWTLIFLCVLTYASI